jgi:hypothetical protein
LKKITDTWQRQTNGEMKGMNILFYYSKPNNGVDEKLQEVIDTIVPQEETEIYRSIEGLSRRLQQPTHNLGIVVLVAGSKEDLLEILSIRDLLNNLRIILILPDREGDTIDKGRALYPRFIGYADGHLMDVAAVLERMVVGLNK